MPLTPLEMIAGGGLAATLAAAWGQIRSTFNYVRSQILVRTNMDSGTRRRVLLHLARTAKRTPGGDQYVFAHWFHPSSGRALLVPFKTRGYAGLWFFHGWPLVILENGIITQRGFPVERLVKEAFEEMRDADTRTTSFSVIDVYGYANENRGSSGLVAKREVDGPVGSPEDDIPSGALPCIDGSFMYEESEYRRSEDAFEHLYYSDSVQTHVQHAQLWFDQRDWYAQHSIPWRRGWLLYGPGGTGKSSMARALAQKMRIPLYRYHLSTLTDQEFLQRWGNMDLPAVVLFEDIDTVFDGRKPVSERNTQLTFDTVLNAISGVNSRDGVFLVVTTNHPDKIDPALGAVEQCKGDMSSRPGRIDTAIHLGFIDEAGRRKMAERILEDWPELQQAMIEKHTDVVPVQFQELCIQAAYNQLMKGKTT